ncbi:hypothetical protein N1851_029482 [Merluccius polli]|uniref:Ubiquitin-like protease family profile domain-containing protein n=1 Tax=Merluccius polli TaxID=89951 RepID=A0AA47NQQ4_MERPO|nr:hypothetical protein N1851_029482 [Merluccius polli]
MESFPNETDKKQRWTLRRRALNYVINDGELFYVRHRGSDKEEKVKVVCGAAEADALFKEFHCSDIGAHCGQIRTRTTKVPFELIGMDLVGKLAMTNQGNQYICVMVDYFTRWSQAYAIKLKSAAEVTQALGKLAIEKPKTWDGYLDAVMFGLRTKRQLTTRFSPFFLMFGREARYPSQVQENYEVDESFEEQFNEEEVAMDIERQDKIVNIVQQNVEKVQERTRGRLQSLQKRMSFKVGDMVWRKNVRSLQRKVGKLDPEFLGPFTVVNIEEKSVDLVDSSGKSIHKVNTDHLKLHTTPTPRIPRRLRIPPVSSITSTPPAATSTPPTTSAPPATYTQPATSSPPAATSAPPATSTPHAATSTPPAATSTPPAATSTSEKYVTEAWDGKNVHVLLSRIGPYKLFYWDICRTTPGQELESEVINATLLRMVQKHNCQGGKKALCIDTYSMTQIWNGKTAILRKCNPSLYGVILGVVNEPNHWILTVIFPSEQRSLVLDPLGNDASKIKRCLETTRAFMRARGCTVSRWKANTVPHSLQLDFTSCGIFAIKYAEKVLAEESPTFPNSEEAVVDYRREIAVTLLNETDDLSELCHCCGEGEEVRGGGSQDRPDANDWIQCDTCGRWYHEGGGRPDRDNFYSCPACPQAQTSRCTKNPSK